VCSRQLSTEDRTWRVHFEKLCLSSFRTVALSLGWPSTLQVCCRKDDAVTLRRRQTGACFNQLGAAWQALGDNTYFHMIKDKESPLASKLSHSLQHKGLALIYVSKRSWAGNEHTLWPIQPAALGHVTTPRTIRCAIYLRNPLLHGLLLIYWFWKDERLSRPSWLTYSGRFTHEVVTCLTVRRAQDREVSWPRPTFYPLCHTTNQLATIRTHIHENS